MVPNRNVYGKPKKSGKGQSLGWAAHQTASHRGRATQHAWREVSLPEEVGEERSEPREVQAKCTPLEVAVHDLAHCERVVRDLTFGRRIGFYQLRHNIGNGNFSQVRLGIHDLTKEQVAVKILDKVHLDKHSQRLFSAEVSCMEKLSHPNVVRLYEVVETFRRLYLVMEYASGGELYSSISSRGRMSDAESRLVFSQILSAVRYMVGDFSFSAEVRPDEVLSTFCGSLPYAAPELFRDEAYVGSFVDLWALGVLLYFMVTASFPFNGPDLPKLRTSVLQGTYAMPSYVPEPCRRVIEGLLTLEPAQRSPIARVMASGWLGGIRYPLPYPPAPPTPAHLAAPAAELCARERAVKEVLEELGITEEHLKNHSQLDCRSPLTGAYRILLHRIQKRSAAASARSASIPANSTGPTQPLPST